MESLFGMVLLVLLLTTDFTKSATVVPPADNKKKVVAAPKPQPPNPVIKAVGDTVGGAAENTAKGAGWVAQELLRPLDNVRNGMIDTFGVPEKPSPPRRSAKPKK